MGLLFILVLPIRAYAEKEFNVNLDVTYRFDKEGVPTVEQKITLTNKTAYQYASKYEMEITADNPTNLKAWDAGGPMKLNIGNKITAYFNSPVAGIDKSYQFYLSYLGKPAVHNGQVWEVSFPKLANINIVDEYRLSVIIPKNFGKLAFASPNPESNNGEVMVFTNAQYGVVAAFGDFQTYKFDLEYSLTGPGTIALPADTGYQRIFYDTVEPRPNNVQIDADGNWIAYYNQEPNQKLLIKARGIANVLTGEMSYITPVSLTSYKVGLGIYKDYPGVPLEVKLVLPQQIWFPVGGTAYLDIDNPNGFAVYGTMFEIQSQNILLEPLAGNRIDIIPAFGKIEIPIKIKPNWQIDFSEKSIGVTASGISKVYNIKSVTYLLWHVSIASLTAFVILTVGFIASRTWSVYLQRQK